MAWWSAGWRGPAKGYVATKHKRVGGKVCRASAAAGEDGNLVAAGVEAVGEGGTESGADAGDEDEGFSCHCVIAGLV
jgi:hypothetical protein